MPSIVWRCPPPPRLVRAGRSTSAALSSDFFCGWPGWFVRVVGAFGNIHDKQLNAQTDV